MTINRIIAPLAAGVMMLSSANRALAKSLQTQRELQPRITELASNQKPQQMNPFQCINQTSKIWSSIEGQINANQTSLPNELTTAYQAYKSAYNEDTKLRTNESQKKLTAALTELVQRGTDKATPGTLRSLFENYAKVSGCLNNIEPIEIR